MNIIRKGKLKSHPFNGKCEGCRCLFELTEEEKVKSEVQVGSIDGKYLVRCPNCNQVAFVKRKFK